jgi:hypothetical protein
MMFQDHFTYTMGDYKPEVSGDIPSPGFAQVGNGNPYGSLEGSLLGPIPPYLLQGQQMMSDVSGIGGNMASQAQQPGQRGGENESQGNSMGQYLMTGSGGEAMIPDFFRDEWDDVLMQQTFRNV